MNSPDEVKFPVPNGDARELSHPADLPVAEATPALSEAPIAVQAAGAAATEAAAMQEPWDEERARFLASSEDVRRGVGRALVRYSHSDPDVLLAETIIKIARARHLVLEDNVGSLAFRVAERLAIDDLRRRSARPTTTPLAEEDALVVPPSLQSPDSSRQVMAHLVVLDLLDCLYENQRKVVQAVYLEGMTMGEAAKALGWAVGTVKSQLHRARKRMKEYALEKDLTPW